MEKLDPIDWMSSIDMEIGWGSLLSKVDKITMANGVEARNPFLDFRLIDSALVSIATSSLGYKQISP